MSPPTPLAQIAIDSLHAAVTNRPHNNAQVALERNVVQPDTWLIRACGQSLADHGAGADALSVAQLGELRQPMALLQTLYRVAKQATQQPGLRTLVHEELAARHSSLLNATGSANPHNRADKLLLAAASAALTGDEPRTITYLETLDQIPKGWDRIFIHPEQRGILAETIVHVGLYPLTDQLITGAIRNFGDSGAQLLQQIADLLAKNHVPDSTLHVDAARADALLQRCARTLHNAALITLFSRRIAATVLAQAGMIDEMVEQLDTIATIQDAHRETGFSHRGGTPMRTSFGTQDDDTVLLRQVIRPRANIDIDFQAYTLRNALQLLPLTRLSEQQRHALAHRLASLGAQSDGWTAAAVVPMLIRLGAVQYAVDVVSRIAENDPTRSEGIIALAGALLGVGQAHSARTQIQAALTWAESLPERTPERAMRWGLAEVYLKCHQPEQALSLLGKRPQPSFWKRMRHMFRDTLGDAELRTDRIRFQALLQQGLTVPGQSLSAPVRTLLAELRTWAPRLLEGEALLNFYIDGMLRPLFAAQQWDESWPLLPAIQETLPTIHGSRHANRVGELSTLLCHQFQTHLSHLEMDAADRARKALEDFVLALWESNSAGGIWQAIYGVEGTLPILMLLEGPAAVVHIAQVAANDGVHWET